MYITLAQNSEITRKHTKNKNWYTRTVLLLSMISCVAVYSMSVPAPKRTREIPNYFFYGKRRAYTTQKRYAVCTQTVTLSSVATSTGRTRHIMWYSSRLLKSLLERRKNKTTQIGADHKTNKKYCWTTHNVCLYSRRPITPVKVFTSEIALRFWRRRREIFLRLLIWVTKSHILLPNVKM